jgi:glyoxalase family protein
MTAICGPAQENVDFYAGVLGLRLIKLTVNFDDPTAYHLYYGDSEGTPGSILTFFPYPAGYPGRPGTGQTTVTALAVGSNSLRFWYERLKSQSVDVESPRGKTMDFHAPDGLKLRLVGNGSVGKTWVSQGIPEEHRIGPMRSVTIEEEAIEGTRKTLVEILGMVEVEPNSFVFEPTGEKIDVVAKPEGPKGRSGHGSVHHVAFRTPDEETQISLREELIQKGYHVSPVMDRTYFKSIYFREPGGVLFEIATDGPGFTADEPLAQLGRTLKLPPQFELYRTKIERSLPKLNLPS